MERNEMLRMLNEQHPAAELVVLTSEMAIECTYVSAKGFKYEWIALDQWPASIITFKKIDGFQQITRLIVEQALKLEDIQGTALWTIYMDFFDEDEDINAILSNLASADYPEGGKFFLLCTTESIMFFSEYDHFEAKFFEAYAADCTPWDTLTDEELEDWIERTKSEFDRIPCIEYELYL